MIYFKSIFINIQTYYYNTCFQQKHCLKQIQLFWVINIFYDQKRIKIR